MSKQGGAHNLRPGFFGDKVSGAGTFFHRLLIGLEPLTASSGKHSLGGTMESIGEAEGPCFGVKIRKRVLGNPHSCLAV
jgi:hypothetical protein